MGTQRKGTLPPRSDSKLIARVLSGVVLLVLAAAFAAASALAAWHVPRPASAAKPLAASPDRLTWIGTWATSAQPFIPKALQTYHNQTLRLIVHTSAGGHKVRIRISNTYGDQPLVIGAAHIARRSSGADIEPASDRSLKFQGRSSVTIPARAIAVSDPLDLDFPPLSDLAISLFLPQSTEAKTVHAMAKQTSYVSPATGDAAAATKFPVGSAIHSWPFLTGVDVAASPGSFSVVAFGSSLTDGDGTDADTNSRWPDRLAQRFQEQSALGVPKVKVGVLNEGIIGNRLLYDSPKTPTNPYGAALGESGLARFERDVLNQPGAKYVIVGLGINDMLFPAFPFTPPGETVSADDIIAGYRQLIARAHKKNIQVIGTTNPAFENSAFEGFVDSFYTPEREATRQKVNAWILQSGEFDGVVDLDAVVRDPSHPTRLLPAYDSGDHLHPNNAGALAEANAIPLALFNK
ncbi:MAG TPA: SGNH/GDSL hydrolase family protein [Candidatus Acidoferrales bacterium]|nr:SGNH/GDSL hydrolase family protein [Candidatus Acidoferrales bacterium]